MNNEKMIWDRLIKEGFTPEGAAGLMGNIEHESGGNGNNLQYYGNTKLNVTDEVFTKMLDSREYTKDKFIHDGFGYGICQWTYYTRKDSFYNFMSLNAKSFGDTAAQVEYMLKELRIDWPACYNFLRQTNSIKDAAEMILKKYEMPADQSDAMVTKRTMNGVNIYTRMMKADYTEKPNNDNVEKAIKLLEEAITLLKS